MNTVVNAAANFLNQNFYGFLLLLIAAFFYYNKLDTPATAFFGAGAAMMGVNRQPSTITTTTPSATISEVK